MAHSLQEILERVRTISENNENWSDKPDLIRAYINCLTFPDLCTAAALTISETTLMRAPIRTRLVRFLERSPTDEQIPYLCTLIDLTLAAVAHDKKLRKPVDVLYSVLFPFLPLHLQQQVLQYWIDHRTLDRWLKAAQSKPDLFDPQFAIICWRSNFDWRAAKALAYLAPPETVAELLPEFVETFEETEGWIVSKAALRASEVSLPCWEKIRERFPATYLYLCAMMSRVISDAEAFDTVCRCSGTSLSGKRGLAVWAIGELGLSDVLDRVWENADALQQRDIEELTRTRF